MVLLPPDVVCIHTHTLTKYFISDIVATRCGFVITLKTNSQSHKNYFPSPSVLCLIWFFILSISKIRGGSCSPTKVCSALRMHCGWCPLESLASGLPLNRMTLSFPRSAVSATYSAVWFTNCWDSSCFIQCSGSLSLGYLNSTQHLWSTLP